MIATVDTSQPSLSSSATNTPDAQREPGEDGAAAGAEESHLPSAQEVAERVYRLFCQDLRQIRERQGRW